ncbi:MAG: monovalent cation/H(+) antiporter subunit G [Desulfatiglandaceae bacterium]
MTLLQNILSVLLVCMGIFFMLVGSIGILRLPDFYSRTHAVSMSDALGISSVMLGLIVYEGFTQSSLKLLLIILFVALSNPIGSHALSRAAYIKKVKPLLTGWKHGDS